MTGVVGLARGKDLVVARDQPHLGFRDGLRRRQRIDEHMDAVIAGKRRQPHVGDDEPLRRQRAVIVARTAGALGRRRHHIDAGLQFAERLVDRKCGNHILVQRGRGREFAGPYLDAALVAEARELVARQRLLEIAVHHRVDQIAIADPEHVDVHRGRIDADQGNAALAGARQHIGAAREAHERLAVAHIDVELGRFRQRLLHRRWQAGAQIDVVALAMLEAVDAELLAFRGQCRLVGAGQRDERRKVDPLGEVLGELEAGARRGAVGIHGVIQQPEAVLVAHLLILAADLGDLAQVERQPQAVQRRTPQLAFGHRAPKHGQRIGLLGLVAGALIGDVGRGRGALIQEGLLARTAGADLEDGLGELQPVRAVLGRGGSDLAEDLQADAEIGPAERGVGVAAQCRGGFGDRPGLTLDLGLQLHRRIGQLIALERLVGGIRRRQAERQRGANHYGANQTGHDGLLAADIGRVTSKSARKSDGLMTVILGLRKVASMALAVQTVPAAATGGVPAAGVKSGADHGTWPAVCLGRDVEKIGSTGLAEKRIFHIGSAT